MGSNLNLAVHVPVDDLGHVGAALGASEGGAPPAAAGDQLERTRRYLLACFRHADDDRGTPATVAGLQGGAHHLSVAGRVEAIIRAAVGQLQDFGDRLLAAEALGVEEVGHAEAAAPFPRDRN